MSGPKPGQQMVKLKLIDEENNSVSYLAYEENKQKYFSTVENEKDAAVFYKKPYKGADYYTTYPKKGKSGLRIDYHTGGGEVYGQQHESAANSWELKDEYFVPRMTGGLSLKLCPSDSTYQTCLFCSARLTPFKVTEIDLGTYK
ncbi:MAG: hypothetical protein MI749_10270 [Desulfovibrionales bacterium]|nr:hypothetical protein [Desulfovibrionales bacterium]